MRQSLEQLVECLPQRLAEALTVTLIRRLEGVRSQTATSSIVAAQMGVTSSMLSRQLSAAAWFAIEQAVVWASSNNRVSGTRVFE